MLRAVKAALILAASAVVLGPQDAGAEERQQKNPFGAAALERALRPHLRTVQKTPVTGTQAPRRNGSRNWCQRRAAACGALIGFGAGYGLGFALGGNPFIDDFVPSADALIVGGIGAAAGGTVGAVVQK